MEKAGLKFHTAHTQKCPNVLGTMVNCYPHYVLNLQSNDNFSDRNRYPGSGAMMARWTQLASL
eukprot:scaffold2830_cov131-Cylindrotheca_fusiformis.AAC.15